jgi:hypothetical protein
MDIELILAYLCQESNDDNYEIVTEALANNATRLAQVNYALSELALIDAALKDLPENAMVTKVDDINLDYARKMKILRREAHGHLMTISNLTGLENLNVRYGRIFKTSYIG